MAGVKGHGFYLREQLANCGIVEERKIVDGVTSESRQVESDEVKVQSDHRFSPEIDPTLRVERDGPSKEINPSNHGTQVLM